MATAITITKKSSSNSSFSLRCPSLNALRLRRIFDVFDKNNDGLLTVDEFSQALSLLGLDADLSELETMVESYIQPGNAGLRFKDFEALHRSLNDVFFGLDENFEAAKQESEQARASQEESDLKEAFKYKRREREREREREGCLKWWRKKVEEEEEEEEDREGGAYWSNK